MKNTRIEDRLSVVQFTDDFIPEGVIKAPDEILDVIAFFKKENTSEVHYIYKVPIPSAVDLEFAECFDVAFPFQFINKGDYVVSLSGIYSCVMKKEELFDYMAIELPHTYKCHMDINTKLSIRC
jgi:hypothetical protein